MSFGASITTHSCLYIRTDGLVILLLYVGDILLSGGVIKDTENTKRVFMGEFKLTDLGVVNTFVGIQV